MLSLRFNISVFFVRFEVWLFIIFCEVQGLSVRCSLWHWRFKCSTLFVKYERSTFYLRFEVIWSWKSKVCEAMWMWVCEVGSLRRELLKLFKCGLWGFFVLSKFWCSWCCHGWLLYSLNHSSNWSIYSFGGDSNNLVCNNAFIPTIDKVSL